MTKSQIGQPLAKISSPRSNVAREYLNNSSNNYGSQPGLRYEPAK